MIRQATPLLKHIIFRSHFDAAGRQRCLRYLKTLRSLRADGYETVFLGETDLSEALVTGDGAGAGPRGPTWSVVHGGSHRGWVPWKYRLFLRDELCREREEGLFDEFCDALTAAYGKCAIVVRERRPPGPPGEGAAPVLGSPSISCCPDVARAKGHELLALPAQYGYLSPLDTAWATLRWFILHNQREFSLRSAADATYAYQFVFFSDLVGKGIERMSPGRWKTAAGKVRRWESYYLGRFS
ncbi:protein FAM243A [Ornithorhynchus anatinus]|uniref:Chromosome 21 open reading frame 140 n=1 Tax=Ornithorhynchus anatinus TaxID=9258 RepID=F6ZQH7_ORNAN|nr:protein FAM243A [Ornithorhynchus anatinus]